eukprot:755683-Hanusia_phi.AAC.4
MRSALGGRGGGRGATRGLNDRGEALGGGVGGVVVEGWSKSAGNMPGMLARAWEPGRQGMGVRVRDRNAGEQDM